MEGWRWRIVLALIGLVLFVCSACLLTTSRLQIHRVRDSDVVPIEAPAVPESRSLHLGVI
ncbi:MAG: hypothetical protein PVI07_04565 [Anaerolineae bacterium]|jgi:hypothetical protein